MTDDNRLLAGVHRDYRAEAKRLGAELAACANETVRAVLGDHAQAAARSRDDNHVGTEHLVLGIYLEGRNRAATVLESKGVSRSLFESVLDDEPGPSPKRNIPYTVRATMIGGLAAAEAQRLGSDTVSELHLVLGAVAESRRWERQHAWGPHHLRAAAAQAATSLEDIEREVLSELNANG